MKSGKTLVRINKVAKHQTVKKTANKETHVQAQQVMAEVNQVVVVFGC